MTIHITSLHHYPVKSCAAVNLSRAWIDSLGLAGDRRYLVADMDGNFMTARKFPKLTTLLATTFNGGLVLASLDGTPAELVLQEKEFSDSYTSATVWKQNVSAQRCGSDADAWISEFLGTQCQLLFFGEQSSRPIKKRDDKQVSFADGYPLLLTSTSSLDSIQTHCDNEIHMAQFRPNIVISGSDAFAEDGWSRIRVGELIFTVHSPCERCKLITLPPRSLTFDKGLEPLRTLIKHHSSEKRAPLFGHNVIAEGTGIIEVGMTVEVLD